ncbi:MAG: hypothetical protein HQK58_00385 [Deltaproteobacteria bacterium]|nr:hypothetical protein [Deltaproteobacteria bacterium]
MIRYIAHVHLPDFAMSIEELRQPELKGKPVAIAEQNTRSVIQGVNHQARQEGIYEGMPVSLARQRCRRLITTPPDLFFYKNQHLEILKDLNQFSPLVEGTTPGRYFVDFSGTQRLWGHAADAVCRLERELWTRRQLRGRLGLAANKLISQVAAQFMSPGELCRIFPGGEPTFLDPLPVASLPGIGPKPMAALTDFNIQRVEQLAALKVDTLTGVFGQQGARLARLAHGEDTSPVVPFQVASQLRFVRNLDKDEIDKEALSAALFRLVEEAGWTLRRHNRYPGWFDLEWRYADGRIGHHRDRFHKNKSNLDLMLFQSLLPALDHLLQRRMAVRRLILIIWDLTMPVRQLSLFPWEETDLRRDEQLQKAVDTIRTRFGSQALNWGRTI